MLRRQTTAPTSKEVRLDAAGSLADDGQPHLTRQYELPSTGQSLLGKDCLARMLMQFVALLGFCLVYVYVISIALSFSSISSLRTIRSSPFASASLAPLSLADAKLLPANATGTFPLQGGGMLHLPDSCQKRLCILTKKGAKGMGSVPNQDQSLILQDRTQLLLALFDGHGDKGHLASSAVVRDLPFRFANTAQATLKEPLHFTREFLAVDKGLVSRIPYAGSTGIVVHFDVSLQRLVVASVGDSTCLIMKGSGSTNPGINSTQILMESVKHKPAMPSEKQRIEGKGGRVFMPPNPNIESSRVLIPGPLGPESYALAMSRSLGDVEGKRLGYLSAEPDVQVVDLKQGISNGDFVYAIVASDGIFDVIKKQDVVQELDRALRSDTLPDVCSRLVDRAIEGWKDLTGGTYRDDITLLVAKLPLR